MTRRLSPLTADATRPSRGSSGFADLAAPLGAACRVTRAEIAYAVREEMAVHLTDALLRRTEAGTAGHPGDDTVRAAATVMAAELGWTPARITEEIAGMNNIYRIETQ